MTAADAAIPCHACGYDVRSQPPDGQCPECGEIVAESIRLAALPLRPAWRDSDRRWRRRVLAGLWALVLMPLPYAVKFVVPDRPFGEPNWLADVSEAFRDSFAIHIWALVVTPIGLALLFQHERLERPRPSLRRLRLAGVAGCWGLIPLAIVSFAGVTLLVLSGIWALLSPVDKQKYVPLALGVANGWSERAYFAGMALGVGIAVLAGIVLADALRRAGSRQTRAILIWVGGSLLAVQAAMVLAAALDLGDARNWVYFELLFSPIYLTEGWRWLLAALLGTANDHLYLQAEPPETVEDWIALFAQFPLELAKWLLILAVALRLTVAQFSRTR